METKEPITELVRGNNAFALDLYGRLDYQDGNRFLSPFSISCALAMTYSSARNETARQVAKALHFTLPSGELHPAFHKLIDELNSQQGAQQAGAKPAGSLQLSTANALWTQTGTTILPDFQKLIESNYGGALFPIDFRQSPAAACQYINHWVEEQTRGKIKDLLTPQNVDPHTVLILTNAIYFKALWASPFAPYQTKPDDFQVSASEKVRVRHDAPDGKLQIHRRRRGTSSRAALPGRKAIDGRRPSSAKDGLAQLEKSLSLEKLEGSFQALEAAPGRDWPAKIQAHRPMRAERAPVCAGHAGCF